MEDLKDGVYRSNLATYYVYQGKVMMRMGGVYYKTTDNFMVGSRYLKDLTEEQMKKFEACFSQCPQW